MTVKSEIKWTRRSAEEKGYSDVPIYKKEWFKEKAWKNYKIPYKNTPLSLGYDISFISNSKFVRTKYRCSDEQMNHCHGKTNPSAGMAVDFDKPWGRMYVISIPHKDKMNVVRLIEIITHESSHIVDYIIEKTFIKKVDTELRAYLLDHIVGLICQRLILKEDI